MEFPNIDIARLTPGSVEYHAQMWNSYVDVDHTATDKKMLSLEAGRFPYVTSRVRASGMPGHHVSDMIVREKAYFTGELKKYARWRPVPTFSVVGKDNREPVIQDLCTGSRKKVSSSCPWNVQCRLNDAFTNNSWNVASDIVYAINTHKDNTDVCSRIRSVLEELEVPGTVIYSMDTWSCRAYINRRRSVDLLGIIDKIDAACAGEFSCKKLPMIGYKSSFIPYFSRAVKASPVLWLPFRNLAGMECLKDTIGEEAYGSLEQEVDQIDNEGTDGLLCIFKIEIKEVENVSEF